MVAVYGGTTGSTTPKVPPTGSPLVETSGDWRERRRQGSGLATAPSAFTAEEGVTLVRDKC